MVLFPLDGWQVATGRVQPGLVVPDDPGEDRAAGFSPGAVVGMVDQLHLEGGKPALKGRRPDPGRRQASLPYRDETTPRKSYPSSYDFPPQ